MGRFLPGMNQGGFCRVLETRALEPTRALVFLVSLSPETAEPEVRVNPGTQPDTPAWVLEGGLWGLAGEAVSLSSHSESG